MSSSAKRLTNYGVEIQTECQERDYRYKYLGSWGSQLMKSTKEEILISDFKDDTIDDAALRATS